MYTYLDCATNLLVELSMYFREKINLKLYIHLIRTVLYNIKLK